MYHHNPFIFQKFNDQTLGYFSLAQAFPDDIIIGRKDLEQYYQNTCPVLAKFRKINIRVKMPMCQFFASAVEYLGHSITPTGVRP